MTNSPDMYADAIAPHDARLLHEVGKGAIHFCGNGQHLVEKMLEIPDLLGLDLGQDDLMDVPAIYAQCRERRVAITHLRPEREALASGAARRQCPTGCVFVYTTSDPADAEALVTAYRST